MFSITEVMLVCILAGDAGRVVGGQHEFYII